MSRPLLALAVALAAGVMVGDGVSPRFALLLLSLAAVELFLAQAAGVGPRLAALLSAATAIGAAAAGTEREAYDRTPLRGWIERAAPAEPVRLRGVAATDANESADGCSFVMAVEGVESGGHEQAMSGRVRLSVGGEAERLTLIEGDRVEAWARLWLPHGLGDPGAFDAAEQARRTRVHALGYCKSRLLVRSRGRAPVGPVRDAAARLRGWARARLQERVAGPTEEGLVRAMVLGDRSGIDRETADAFRVAGTYHVLALSGAQVALVAAILAWVLRRLSVPPIPAALAVAASLAFYARLVGAEVPVARAAAMGIVLVAGRAIGLDADLANLLGLAGGVLLVDSPGALGDVGFQLSFGATLAILLLARPVADRLPRLRWGLQGLVAASLATQAALAPLMLVHFHRLAPAALVLNIAAIPLSAAVLLTGFAVLFAAAVCPPLAPSCALAAWASARLLLLSATLVRGMPFVDPRFPAPSALALAVHLAGLSLLVDRGRFARGVALTAAGLALTFLGAGAQADGRLHLTVLDVDQGDALVLRSPSGRVTVIDAGVGGEGRLDMGEAVVAPFLWSTGVRQLERLIATHADADHAGGVPFLLRHFDVHEAWEGTAPRHDPGYRRLDSQLRGAVARRSVGKGVAEGWDQVSLQVLGPGGGPPPWRTRNDDSVVIRVVYGRVSFLLTGDIERGAERRLALAPADVLKVPHHGSRSSSTPAFIAAVSPRVAIMSVGARNPFGHPHPEVLERYRRAGILVLRTDLDGAVTVSTDGQRLWVQTHREGREFRVR